MPSKSITLDHKDLDRIAKCRDDAREAAKALLTYLKSDSVESLDDRQRLMSIRREVVRLAKQFDLILNPIDKTPAMEVPDDED